jgi:hypothetical protein
MQRIFKRSVCYQLSQLVQILVGCLSTSISTAAFGVPSAAVAFAPTSNWDASPLVPPAAINRYSAEGFRLAGRALAGFFEPQASYVKGWRAAAAAAAAGGGAGAAVTAAAAANETGASGNTMMSVE